MRLQCCKLYTAVYSIGLCLTALYSLAGVCIVVWFIVCNYEDDFHHTRHHHTLRMESMLGSLAVMGSVLVIATIGLVSCLLLILGVKTKQRLLILPWQVFHAVAVLGSTGGGLYQAIHYTRRADTLLACLAILPILGGILFIFFCMLVHQLTIRMKYWRQMDKILEEKRASLASIHLSLQAEPKGTLEDTHHRSVRSIRALKRKREGSRSRCRSVENMLASHATDHPDYWVENRSRSLPRHLERTCHRDPLLVESEWRRERRDSGQCVRKYRTVERRISQRRLRSVDDVSITERSLSVRRREDSCHSLNSSKSVSIHPEVTQYRYSQYGNR